MKPFAGTLIMPELPEVETVVRDLRPLLLNRIITSMKRSQKPLRQKWSKSWEKNILQKKVIEIQRRGKWILSKLDNQSVLVTHLGMTGQFTVVPSIHPKENHTHFIFLLDNQTELRYRDIRRFGSVTWSPSISVWENSLEEKLGPEPFGVDPEYWWKHIKHSKRNLKALLLDQSIVAGVGNIYADESCFRAQLDPRRLGTSLSKSEAERLRIAVEEVLTIAIESRGSTIRNYVGGSGLQGEFQEQLQVYGRAGQCCFVCESILHHVRLAGRTTTFCPVCQKRP
ncbi:MAG: bifunctional DNA-formamidopyrimidine glycosylase/DNA-(apurinic or apyrimidinic site) lyase [Gemmataceae bacterium]|nr:bifunctional DNA-formamidopyrimidine glycosylase/DNA-(apurinic or apyrimidinic site) lyase [Gemmataceae bacterium]